MHRTGSFNEVSARYSVMKDEFYVPDPVRKQSESNRQGSSDEIVTTIPQVTTHTDPGLYIKENTDGAYEDYQLLLNAGVARELARTVLPVSLYTEFYWTVNLWNLMHFLKLRLDKHAQYEIRVFGEAILKLLNEQCDLKYTLEAFQDYILDDPKLSKYELKVIRQFIASSVPSMARRDSIETIQQLIEAQSDMSKREKQESKLIELLFEEENDRITEVQSNISEKSSSDS